MDTEREKQEFNFAVSDLGRLNIMCAKIEDALMDLNLYDLYFTLQTLSATLSPYMKPEEITYFDKTLETLWDQVNSTFKQAERNGKNTIPKDIYKQLKGFYIQLRKIQKDSDLLGRSKDDFLQPENW